MPPPPPSPNPTCTYPARIEPSPARGQREGKQKTLIHTQAQRGLTSFIIIISSSTSFIGCMSENRLRRPPRPEEKKLVSQSVYPDRYLPYFSHSINQPFPIKNCINNDNNVKRGIKANDVSQELVQGRGKPMIFLVEIFAVTLVLIILLKTRLIIPPVHCISFIHTMQFNSGFLCLFHSCHALQ